MLLSLLFQSFLITTNLWPSFALGQAITLDSFTPGAVIFANEIYKIEWSGGDGSAITLKLLRGGDTYTESLETLFEGPSDPPSVEWYVPITLEDATDYLLGIEQGSDYDYSLNFEIVGGVSTSSSPSLATATTLRTSVITAASTVPEPSETLASISDTLLATRSSSRSISSAASTTLSQSSSQTSSPSARREGTLSPGAIAGISIGSIGALALVVIAVLLVPRKKSKKIAMPPPRGRESTMSELSAAPYLDRRELHDGSAGRISEKDSRMVRLSTTTLQELPTNTGMGR